MARPSSDTPYVSSEVTVSVKLAIAGVLWNILAAKPPPAFTWNGLQLITEQLLAEAVLREPDGDMDELSTRLLNSRLDLLYRSEGRLQASALIAMLCKQLKKSL